MVTQTTTPGQTKNETTVSSVVPEWIETVNLTKTPVYQITMCEGMIRDKVNLRIYFTSYTDTVQENTATIKLYNWTKDTYLIGYQFKCPNLETAKQTAIDELTRHLRQKIIETQNELSKMFDQLEILEGRPPKGSLVRVINENNPYYGHTGFLYDTTDGNLCEVRFPNVSNIVSRSGLKMLMLDDETSKKRGDGD